MKIEGLEHNVELEELYLSHNGIEVLENVEHLVSQLLSHRKEWLGISQRKVTCDFVTRQTRLTVMDLGANRISAIPSTLRSLTELEDLWLNDNGIASFEDVEKLVPLAACALRTLYLERNPLASDFEYRKKLETLLPQLDQIDAVPTTKARQH